MATFSRHISRHKSIPYFLLPDFPAERAFSQRILILKAAVKFRGSFLIVQELSENPGDTAPNAKKSEFNVKSSRSACPRYIYSDKYFPRHRGRKRNLSAGKNRRNIISALKYLAKTAALQRHSAHRPRLYWKTARFVRNGHAYHAEFDRQNLRKPSMVTGIRAITGKMLFCVSVRMVTFLTSLKTHPIAEARRIPKHTRKPIILIILSKRYRSTGKFMTCLRM